MNSQDGGGMALPILQGSAKHKDRVCGMLVAPEKAAGKVERAGKTYYFCSKSCTERFSHEPEKFLAAPGTGGMGQAHAAAQHGARQHTASAASGSALDEKKVRYTCPMHPEIIQIGPGSCPICGIALDPLAVLSSLATGPTSE